MKKSVQIIFVLFLMCGSLLAQNDTIKLKEVEVTSNRISIPFSKSSRTISIISSEEIQKSSATNVGDLLQQIVGVDIRRRGVEGMQADLYIRGGNFDQTLVLIDGIKMDDVQTGHHSMNAVLDLNAIERIEVIKGPAARIFGQNAFTGAINIITKSNYNNSLGGQLNYGSYENKKAGITFSQKITDGGILAAANYQNSDGYRFNTDFENTNALVKGEYKNYSFLSSFSERKFGANGFYASPAYKDQYEETQTSLIAASAVFNSESVTIKPRLYWRRNQDMYLFLRDNPSFYRNLHISNKIGAETNVVITSKYGKTGIGVDVARVFLVSNNLGDHNRTAITGFLEHRFELLNNKLDITPGVAVSYYSDFDTQAFPGLDLGYQLSDQVKLYGNIGYTYRVPTFTDLFYVGPTTLGNPNLQPESALSEEIGLKYTNNSFKVNFALFNRKSDDLIDWTKENETDKWQTQNFSEVVTKGFEASLEYGIRIGSNIQTLQLGYTFLEDDIKDTNVAFTRYSLNSLKHQVSSLVNINYCNKLSQQIAFRFVERTNGETYNVLDSKLNYVFNQSVSISLAANNIFNATYTETNLVPMPKGNVMAGINFRIY